MGYDYYMYAMSSNFVTSGTGALVSVTETGGSANSGSGNSIDGSLTDAGNTSAGGAGANETFTIGGTTYIFWGGYANGDFRAFEPVSGNAYFFSSNNSITSGTTVAGPDGSTFAYLPSDPTAYAFGNNNNTSVTLTCFLPGTLIRTTSGDVAVEKLAIGQLVTLADGRALPVKFVGRQTIAPLFADPLKTAPICIKAGSLGENVPSRDLYTSAGHGMVIDGVLATSAALVNGRSIVRAQMSAPRITYHHIELDEHAVIFANDAPTETFVDNIPREAFDNAAEYTALYGEAKPIVEMALPRAKSARQMPALIRARLAKRADAMADAMPYVA